MKRLAVTLLSLLTLMPLFAQGDYKPTEENLRSREDFANRRFGIFLHWGLYSMFAQGEWYLNSKNMSAKEYAKSMNAFYPHDFNADAWVKAIKDSGAGYICLTSRHHDGFSLWNTAASDYNIMNTPYGKDIIRQLADACHKNDVRLHLYYSHLDWTRPDYPQGRTGHGTGRDPKLANWASYYTFMNLQLTELLTNYGPIGAIWFDGWWDHDSDATPFDWQLPEQYALIHRLQPACLVGNNHHQASFPGEDMQIFERDVPGENKAGLSGQTVDKILPLETCQTMNGMWGYKIQDQNYKSTEELVQLLVRTAAKGANLLLNIGPQPDGNLPETALSRLAEMGKWMRANGHTIRGTRAGGFVDDSLSVVSTRTDEALYLHLLGETLPKEIVLPAEYRVRSAVDLQGNVVKFKRDRRTGSTLLTIPAGGAQRQDPDYILSLTLRP